MDGFSSYSEPPATVVEIEGERAFPAERWPHIPLEADTVLGIRRWVTAGGIPVVMGIKTPSAMESRNVSEIECMMRAMADRWLVLHRPEIYCATADVRQEDRNVVGLTGTSPQWWDTRCSRLRFRPRDLAFETVV